MSVLLVPLALAGRFADPFINPTDTRQPLAIASGYRDINIQH